MSKAGAIFSYSIGKKLIMALSGIFLVVFLIVHLLGNLLLLVGPEAFIEYAHFMGTNPVIRIAEVGLFAFFAFHIVDGLWLWSKNRKARDKQYAVSSKGANASWFSKNMHWTGIVILTFLILHLVSFWFLGRFGIDINLGADPAYQSMGADKEVTLYFKSVSHFQVWWYSLIYIVAMAFVGFHINHGFQSAFQSLGIDHSKFKTVIKGTGTLLAIVLSAGYAAIPLYFLIEQYV